MQQAFNVVTLVFGWNAVGYDGFFENLFNGGKRYVFDVIDVSCRTVFTYF